MKLKILSGKEIKEIHQMLKERYEFDKKLNYGFLMSGKGRIWICSREIGEMNLKGLNIEAVGLYFCYREKALRLSIEGAQLIGQGAKKNVIELDRKQVQKWIRGFDLETKQKAEDGYVILRAGEDIIGCGKYKEGKILNIVRTSRRIKRL